MGKKGKGNKLSKMSEEERARYLQMRADIEEEVRRRKIQLISMYMKNKIKREDAFCRLNTAKINQQWRSILRQVKCHVLRNEVLDIKEFFKQALERKEKTISRLLRDIGIVQDLHAMLEQSYLEVIDTVLSIQQQRISHLQRYFEQTRAQNLGEYKKDFADCKQARDHAQIALECVTFQLESNAKKLLESNHEKYLKHLDNVKSWMLLRLEVLTYNCESKLKQFWQLYQQILSGYVQRTEQFYTEYMDLKEQDEENTDIMREQYHEIERMTDQLSHLKLKLADTFEKSETKITYLIKTKNYLNVILEMKKDEFKKQIKRDIERLNLMTMQSHQAVKHFQLILRKGEVVLKLGLACDKYEADRVMMQPLNSLHSENDVRLNQITNGQHPSFHNWHKMDDFRKRANNIAIDIACLQAHKRHLEEEHDRLKIELQVYLIQLNISNGSNLHIHEYLLKKPINMHSQRVSCLVLEGKDEKHHQNSHVKFGNHLIM